MAASSMFTRRKQSKWIRCSWNTDKAAKRRGRWKKGNTKILEMGGGARQAPYIMDARDGRHLPQAK